MSPAGFEPTISAGERPQTYALDRAATGSGFQPGYSVEYNRFCSILQITILLSSDTKETNVHMNITLLHNAKADCA